MTGTETATGHAAVCCDLHNPAGDCDMFDCGPCCPQCPTCPQHQHVDAEFEAAAAQARQGLDTFRNDVETWHDNQPAADQPRPPVVSLTPLFDQLVRELSVQPVTPVDWCDTGGAR